MNQVIFRADASSDLGGGHIYRCLTLADTLQQMAVERNRIHFICRELPGHLAALIEQRGFSVTLLPGATNTLDQSSVTLLPGATNTLDQSSVTLLPGSTNTLDQSSVTLLPGATNTLDQSSVTLLPGATNMLDQSADAFACRAVLYQRAQTLGPISWLIVDHYQLDHTWQRILSPLSAQLAVIDDLANRHHLCDLLFDQSLNRSKADYLPWLTSRCHKVITGAQQALLRPQFMALRDTAKQQRANTTAVRCVLVAMGATDPDNVTQQVLSQLQCQPKAQQWRIDVVLTDQAKHLGTLKNWLARQTTAMSVQLHVNVSDMANLILKADIAIAAAGTSMLERCCLGLPSVLVCLADNQRHIANAVRQNQSAIAVLDKDQLDDQLPQTLENFTRHLASYQQIAAKAFAICNGDGAINLCRQMQQPRVPSSLILQPVCQDDMALLYQWQLAPKTRQYARNVNAPTPAQHQQWFDAVIWDRKIHFYLLKQGKKACGYVRLNPRAKTQRQGFEVSVALAPDCYGQGLGFQALELIKQLHCEQLLLAYIEPHNSASIKTFSKAGFSPLSDNWYQHLPPKPAESLCTSGNPITDKVNR